MFEFISQYFCRHIWKLEKQEYLSTTERRIVGYFVESWDNYANHYVCLKCEKRVIEESKRPISNPSLR